MYGEIRDGTPNEKLAAALTDHVICQAAKESKMAPSQLRQIPPGNVRRRLHDDVTVIVVRL